MTKFRLKVIRIRESVKKYMGGTLFVRVRAWRMFWGKSRSPSSLHFLASIKINNLAIPDKSPFCF